MLAMFNGQTCGTMFITLYFDKSQVLKKLTYLEMKALRPTIRVRVGSMNIGHITLA